MNEVINLECEPTPETFLSAGVIGPVDRVTEDDQFRVTEDGTQRIEE